MPSSVEIYIKLKRNLHGAGVIIYIFRYIMLAMRGSHSL